MVLNRSWLRSEISNCRSVGCSPMDSSSSWSTGLPVRFECRRRRAPSSSPHPRDGTAAIVEARGASTRPTTRQGGGASPSRGRASRSRAARWSRSWARAARQDDAAQLPLRPRRDRRRRGPDRGRRPDGDVGSRAHRLPRAAHGLRLPVLQPDAGADAVENVELPLLVARVAARRRRAAGRSTRSSWSGSRERAEHVPDELSGGAAPARRRSPARSSTTRRSSGPTSPRATSTARTPRRSSRSCAG